MNSVLLGRQTTRDGTTVDYIFHKDDGRFYASVHGFAVGQNNSNRVTKMDCNTIYDLQAHLKGKNVKWEPEAIKLFPELEESKKMKLTKEEKQLVREYAKKLFETAYDYVYFTIINPKLDEIFQDSMMSDIADSDTDDKENEVYKLPIKYSDKFEDLAMSNGFDSPEDYVILDNAKFESKKLKGKKIIKESNTYTMLSALREITDDLLLQTEMMIDNYYGKVDHKEFKNEWYKVSNTFEKKFNQINKNMLSAAKTGK